MKNFIAISMLLLLSLRVIAGDPGGISLLVKALPSANDYKYCLLYTSDAADEATIV